MTDSLAVDARAASLERLRSAAAEPGRAPAGFWTETWRRLRRDRLSMAALAGFLLICLLALSAPLTTGLVLRVDPNRQRLEERFAAPTAEHWLGTDEFGRDELARLLFGAQVSLGIGFVVAAISITLGTVVGLWAGYYGGWVDDAINAVIQVKRAIPFLYLLILVAMIWQPTPLTLALLFGVWSWSGEARLLRGQTFAVRQRDYVEAAKVVGARDRRILFQHILPNVTSILLVSVGFTLSGTILAEAAISFLGFGIQPPTPSWGNMLNNSLEYLRRGWWLVAAPGLAISLTVLCIFLLVDGLRDALDPRLK